MKANIKNLQDDESIFYPNIIEYYENRPDSLETYSLASFAAYYEHFQKNNDKGPDDNLKEDDNINEGDAFIKDKPLRLKNGMGFLRMRRKAAIIRYFRPNKEDTEQHVKTTMLLFYPFRNEQTEVHKHSDIVKKYEKLKEVVDYERHLFEPNPNFMEELNNIRIEDNESDEDEEQVEQEVEEAVTNKEFQNMLKTKTYNGDKSYNARQTKP